MTPLPDSEPEAAELLERLRASAAALRDRPLQEVLRVLGRAGSRFLDPRDPLRREAEERIPEDAGYSSEMAHAVVEGMARDWTEERLAAAVRADFPDPGVLDGFRPGAGGERLRALGADLTFHLGAGSVPGVTATSLVRALLVKSPSLVKPGRGDRVLPELLGRAIAEEDEALARSFEVLYWPGGEGGPLEEGALGEADCVVVYGGNETVRQVRDRLAPDVRLIAYHHRVSVGIVARERLEQRGDAVRLAREAARAVAMFDQQGCVSPHVVWVEEGGAISPAEWAGMLAEELAGLDEVLPPAPVPDSVASRIRQLRDSTEFRAAAGTSDRVYGGEGGRWTVLFEEDPAFAPSCLGRTVRVKPLPSLEAAGALLGRFSGALQTVALEAEGKRRTEMAETFARAGAARITTLREQPWPPAWWRHDGRGPLEVLVRWVSLEE